MFARDDTASLTIDELTWLSASTLIENHHALAVGSSRCKPVSKILIVIIRSLRPLNGVRQRFYAPCSTTRCQTAV